ncbi:hypothetical protein LCL95_13875 [Bacillus timonensis]|nr:hypothetical protein [Bacillus timonensis]
MKKSRLYFITAILLLLLSACSWNPNDEYHAQEEDKNGTKLMTNKDDKDFYKHNLDDQDYTTNQNPNFIDLTEDRLDIGDDQAKIVDVIETYTNYEPGAVIVNGQEVWVTVHTDKDFSKEEEKAARKALHKRLIKAMPRYEIHVKIEQD